MMTVTAQGGGTIRAIALVGFYRGSLVEPGTVLELSRTEFAELKSFNQVDYAPAVEAKTVEVKAARK